MNPVKLTDFLWVWALANADKPQHSPMCLQTIQKVLSTIVFQQVPWSKYLEISPIITFNGVAFNKAGENVSNISRTIGNFVWSLSTDPIIQSSEISRAELTAKVPHQNKEWGMIVSSLKPTINTNRIRKQKF